MNIESLGHSSGEEGKMPPFMSEPRNEKDLSLKKIPVIDDQGGVLGLADSEEEAREMYMNYRKTVDLH
jgi:hypothetical protein